MHVMYLLFGFLLTFTAIFLILLVLVQRGRGGGLAGALGGMGGQSAFGSKAGDLFTRLTMGTAVVWVLLCVASIYLLGGSSDQLSGELGSGAPVSEGPVVTEPLGDSTAVPPAAPAAPGGSNLPEAEQ
jgi:preprotein translocase subunit SecG